MRKLTSILLLVCGTQLAAGAEMWRWVDANGVTHYSDRPTPGAERMVIQNGPSNGARLAPPGAIAIQKDATPFRYTRCAITGPTNDQVFNSVNSVGASLEVEPFLQQGHRIQVMLNGRVVPEWPQGALSYTLSSLYRGSYTLTASILDADGKIMCNTPAITFHNRQPSILSPARQRAN
jgi:Domain of unknown function (DUF4124)